ncbi:MAG TPA: FUSC family protein [Candidatus Dormibacteraeota bacterium]
MTGRAPPWRPLWPFGRRLDPGLVALRRGARVALVLPLGLLFGKFVIGDPQALLFIVFGCIALLSMADFGGAPRERWLAYLGAMVAGAAVVALGTLASATTVTAAAVTLVVGFALAFFSVFGGYVDPAQKGLLLAFVIAVALPTPASATPARVGGWMLAGVLATIAAAFLWPRPKRAGLPNLSGEAILAVAEVVHRLRHRSGLAQALDEARRAVRAARQEYAAGARRPAGLTRRDRAYFELSSELEQMANFAERPFQAPQATTRPCIDEGDRLEASVLDALRASAAVLTGGALPDLSAVVQARSAHRAALDRWAAEELTAGRPAGEVLDGIDADHTLRVIAHLTIGLGENAVIAAGRGPEAAVAPPAAIRPRAGAGGVAGVARTIRTHLQPRSPVLQNSLRLAIGLALSVVLVRSLDLSHGYWAVLGTLQVLRTSALGTGRTTIQALAGNAIGFAVGGLFAVLAGNHPLLWWVALPFGAFVAAYAVTTLGFLVSQAAFTVNLIVTFNILSPAGWQVGLVRIEDVVVGAGVSVVAGVLLWPRGARRALVRSVSSFYRATAAYLERAFDRVLGFDAGGDVDPLRGEAERAGDRAVEALDLLISERAAKHLEPQTAATMVSAGNHGMLAADIMTVVATDPRYRASGCPDGAAALRIQARTLLARFLSLADQLEQGRPASGTEEPVSAEALRAAALGCLTRWDNDEAGAGGAFAAVIAREWAQNLAWQETDLEPSVRAAVDAARIPWWR